MKPKTRAAVRGRDSRPRRRSKTKRGSRAASRPNFDADMFRWRKHRAISVNVVIMSLSLPDSPLPTYKAK
jgi:hypothetical protein